MAVKKSVLQDKKNTELYLYIQPQSRFTSKAVQFAFEILKERGEVFSDDETSRILKLIEFKVYNESQEIISDSQPKWDTNSVVDVNAIQMYSQLAIFGFSLFFGVIFGTVLLAFNFKALKKYNYIIPTIIFGILYTAFQITAINYLEEINFSFNKQVALFSGIGAAILHYVFWENLIEKELVYRKKSITIPLVISIIVYIPIIYVIFIAKL